MEIEEIIKSLEIAQKEKFIKFISDKGSKCCEKCLQFDEMIFKIDDPNKPTLPIHPNCRCKYEVIENPQIEKIKFRLQQMIEQLRQYSEQIINKACELIEKARELLKKVNTAKTKMERLILASEIATLIITIQCVIFSMEKIKNTIDLLNKTIAELGLQFVNPLTAIRDFDKNLSEIKNILKELHYARLNEPDQDKEILPKSPEEAIKRGFIKAPDSQNRYHRNKDQSGNEKYYHPETGQEVVFDKNGKIVTAPENIGTQNYGSDPTSPQHVIYDVLPYWIWGNSEKDTTPFWDRVWGVGK